MVSKDKMAKRGRDYVVIISSLIALFFIYLTFTRHWLYIIPSVILMMSNQLRLTKKS